MVDNYIDVTVAQRRLYWTVSGTHLHDSVAAHTNLGVGLLASTTNPARAAFASSIAESSLLAGRIEFFDLSQPIESQESFLTALQAAQEGGDTLMAAAVLAHMAFIPAFSGDARRAEEARDKMRAARAFARRGPSSPEMLAWMDAVEAEVETLFGDTRKALRLIGHAEEVIGMVDSHASPTWLDWFSPLRLAGFKGNTLLADGQLGPARQSLLSALESTRQADLKQRAITFADLAAVEARAEHPEESCGYAAAALDNLSQYWYATAMERLRGVRQLLTRWEGLKCVGELDDRLYDWNTTLNSLRR